eukprot:CAMPEP_0197285172 /NCGR_PEP_ID=MMETSP0890-20130614/387_1 /TAXON_ID=44058 ORGANISM="Aureoumbra lagunensis, Strain CCMP1510" /NCGR_SAMPLE_ID=MMETSP0890 /ASSEMBLY_ACC=CAM_ASM_000533 /LENGTH=184 /DNA_ID=CAMNT_0042752435 /DNA_START=151 /DNA_END=705 /DNA_ORIENTATION=+
MIEGGESPSRSRHSTWSAEIEAALNEHISMELAAGYQYRAMANFFRADSVNLKNTAKFFAENADEEWNHHEELSKYQILRGGRVEYKPLDAPVHDFSGTEDKSDARIGFESALAMEKKVYDSLLRVHAICGRHNDPACEDKIEEYLTEQIEAIDNLARIVADLDRIGTDGHAVWHFDQEFSSSS